MLEQINSSSTWLPVSRTFTIKYVVQMTVTKARLLQQKKNKTFKKSLQSVILEGFSF